MNLVGQNTTCALDWVNVLISRQNNLYLQISSTSLLPFLVRNISFYLKFHWDVFPVIQLTNEILVVLMAWCRKSKDGVVYWSIYALFDLNWLNHQWNIMTLSSRASFTTIYPKKYAHGFCFAVLCCGYTLTDFPMSTRLTSLALWQSNDCPSANKATLMNMDKHFMWIHYERLPNHNNAKHNKTVCIFLGIYCNRDWLNQHRD